MRYDKSKTDLVFNIFNILLMLIIIFITLYPFWFAIVGSLNEGLDYMRRRGVTFWPSAFTLNNYRVVFMEEGILDAFEITIYRTIAGTITHLLITSMFAYAFSKKFLMGRNFYAVVGFITMFFSGGLIPAYLLRQYLGLLDTFWVFIIPAMINFWNVIIFRSFFQEIPDSISESAKIDGAGEYRIFFRLIVPLSLPVFAVIALFVGVYHWNDFWVPMVFTRSPRFETIQLFLMSVIRTREAASALQAQAAGIGIPRGTVNPLTIQMATMIVTTVPIMLVYPFLQKYFVKGIMIGSVKG